jgi:hypothetical protein
LPPDGSKREIPFAALKPADVGAVHGDDLGERFLAIPAILADSLQIEPQRALKIAFNNAFHDPGLLLEGLHAYQKHSHSMGFRPLPPKGPQCPAAAPPQPAP